MYEMEATHTLCFALRITIFCIILYKGEVTKSNCFNFMIFKIFAIIYSPMPMKRWFIYIAQVMKKIKIKKKCLPNDFFLENTLILETASSACIILVDFVGCPSQTN